MRAPRSFPQLPASQQCDSHTRFKGLCVWCVQPSARVRLVLCRVGLDSACVVTGHLTPHSVQQQQAAADHSRTVDARAVPGTASGTLTAGMGVGGQRGLQMCSPCRAALLQTRTACQGRFVSAGGGM